MEDLGKHLPSKPLQSKKYIATQMAMKEKCTDCKAKNKIPGDHKK